MEPSEYDRRDHDHGQEPARHRSASAVAGNERRDSALRVASENRKGEDLEAKGGVESHFGVRSNPVERPHTVEISGERKPSQRRREQREQMGKPERAAVRQ